MCVCVCVGQEGGKEKGIEGRGEGLKPLYWPADANKRTTKVRERAHAVRSLILVSGNGSLVPVGALEGKRLFQLYIDSRCFIGSRRNLFLFLSHPLSLSLSLSHSVLFPSSTLCSVQQRYSSFFLFLLHFRALSISPPPPFSRRLLNLD